MHNVPVTQADIELVGAIAEKMDAYCSAWFDGDKKKSAAYMNVWRDAAGDHQWTDVDRSLDPAINTRELADRVAESIASKPENGIYRLGILRVTLKGQQAGGAA